MLISAILIMARKKKEKKDKLNRKCEKRHITKNHSQKMTF